MMSGEIGSHFQEGGPDEEEKEVKSPDGAYWWFINLFDSPSAREHQDVTANITAKDYDNFVDILADDDRKKLIDIHTGGIKNTDDKQFIELMASGFSEFVESQSKQEE